MASPRRGINRRMITKSGGIELMVQSMLRFPDDLEIQDTRRLAAPVRNDVQTQQMIR